MDDLVTEKLKERIRERMNVLGKNPSSVALEANLSRSAVRDILSGKAKNPGIVTIYAIARALECGYGYLTGEMDELHYSEDTNILIDVFARTTDISGVIEAGVFRQLPATTDPDEISLEFGQRKRVPLRSNHRYLHRDLYLYRVADDSLAGKRISKGDILTAVFDPTTEAAPQGALIVAAHRLAGAQIEELSARIVKRHRNGITLSTSPEDWGGVRYPDIELTEKLEDYAHYKTSAGGVVFIEGTVVELTRQLDV